MLKLLKLGAVLFGLALAFISYTDEAKADSPTPRKGGCAGSGTCGVTSNGTLLFGSWSEQLNCESRERIVNE